jgi:O-antigen ligase
LIKAVGDFVIVLVVLSDAEPVAAFQRVLKRMTYVLIPLSVLFIKYYPNLGVQWSPWGGKAGYGGVTTNKNTLGAICLCFGLGCLWRFVDAWKHREMPRRTAVLIAQIGVLFMIMWLFWITDSKTSLLTFIMGGTVLIAANSRMVVGRRWMLHLLIVTMLFISSSVVFLGASPEALKAMGRNPTLTDRTEVWGVLLTLVTNPVFGTGFESFWLGPRLERMWSLYWWHPGEAHNGYLEIYLNLGWVGVLLLVAVIIISYRAVFRAWGRHPMATLAMAYVYSGLVYNFTEAAFFRMLAPTWIFFLFGVTAAALRTKIDPFTSPITASADSSSSAGATVTCDAVA